MFRRQEMLLICAGLLAALMPVDKSSAASLQDPTRPPQRFVTPVAPESVAINNWHLGSILIAPQRRVAVINGCALSVGDQVHGAKVVAIEPDQVRLRQGRREIVLVLLTNRPTVTAVAEQQ